MRLNYFQLSKNNVPDWQLSLEALEEKFTYPLGDDSFSISHGKDYLAFFHRIGGPSAYAVVEDQRIVAVGAGVISKRLKAWYLCDMKVVPEFRGKKIPRKMFTRYFLLNYLRCRRGFALNMESEDGTKNPIVKIMQNFPWTPFKLGGRVLFYYEDEGGTNKALSVLSSARENIHFSSLSGKKDLILKSTGKAIPLLHMEWGKTRSDEAPTARPQEGKLHMWALDEKDPLVNKLALINLKPKASGLIYHHRMDGTDWSGLRTSEL